jgi:predicted dehydrogenase
MNSKPVKLGIIGAGHLGKIHIRLAKENPEITLTGFYDSDSGVRKTVSEDLGVHAFETPEELLDSSDGVVIVTPTVNHFEYASKALKMVKHVFVEKPITAELDDAKTLCKLADEAKVVLQVGHVERFNPAFTAAREYIHQPAFIECHRLAQFNPRGTDVSVIYDLMIHDIDIILCTVKSRVKKVHASGVAIVSDTPDICNARIEFENGCTANLTASRMSMKNMRKTRFFQRDCYIGIDFLEKKSEIFSLKTVEGDGDPSALIIDPGPDKPKKQLTLKMPDVQPNNAIFDEHTAFVKAIRGEAPVTVSGYDGLYALEVARTISDKLNFAVASLQ